MSERARVRARARAGFTMIELMTALVAGSFVVIGAYYLSTVSSRVFSEQLRRSETQMTLRGASEQLRRDIGRAGYLSVRDSGELRGCNTAALLGTYGNTAEEVSPRAVFAARVEVGLPGVQGQALTLTGNLVTNEQYMVVENLTDQTSLLLQNTREGYRRSFNDPQSGAFLQARFLEAFASVPDPANLVFGRMVSVVDLNWKKVFLRDIASVNLGTVPPSVVLRTPLPTAGSPKCLSHETMFVAPVAMFRYAIEMPGADLARVGGRNYLTGANSAGAMHPVLVRRELDMTNNQPIPGTERVILDSIAANGFLVEAIFDSDPLPLTTTLTHTATPETLVNSGAIRSLIISLIVESAESSNEGNDVARRSAAAGRRALRFETSLPNAARNSGTF